MMIITFLILAPLRQTFIYDALWWKWVSMFIVHIPLLVTKPIAFAVFIWIYRLRLKTVAELPLRGHVCSISLLLFPASLTVTHVCTIVTASWWFLLPSVLPFTCAYVFFMALATPER